ncbi:hypothetical protein C0581_05125 [Candidatus Parcubacteria bacterium]|nr:MAG: hypothetical protein C0581_05125 [Candidatus Parcubacteria bacterium]
MNNQYKPIQLHKPRKWPWVLFVIVSILFGTGWYAYTWLKQLDPADIFESEFVRDQVERQLGEDKAELFDLLPGLLGFTEKKTYLVLLLNNTEMRPGGGFIGTYAVVEANKGSVNVLEVEGTERIDGRTPASWNPKPIPVLEEHLHVDKWYFRDSNWSPDFPTGAQKALELYKGESGVAAERIDTVVAITTTVLEELLEITGPIEIQGITFDAQTGIETLEYEVEYGFKKRGISFAERKQIIEPFMSELMDRLTDDVFQNLDIYEEALNKMTEEKHLFVYSKDEDFQKKMDEYDWSGRMHESTGDYLLWTDANLAALKTDHAMERTLSYSLSKRPPAHELEDFHYLAAATMTYTNNGSFDWRTTRYRTYARVFVPLGSKLVSVVGSMKWDRTDEEGVVDEGIENGRQWFGTFIAIEPGETKSLEFIYRLPAHVTDDIENDSYTLFVQKQLGTINHGLTLGLDFGKTITVAKPAEDEQEWFDTSYTYSTDLHIDREFHVSF